MAKYFMELSLVDYECVKFLPSEIAAAALYIAMKADDDSEWTPTVEFYSTYSETKLMPCARRIALLITKTLDGSAKQKVRQCEVAAATCFADNSVLFCQLVNYFPHFIAENRLLSWPA